MTSTDLDKLAIQDSST